MAQYRGVLFLRIISGSKRGLKLYVFEGKDIRPTTDRVKENIFNIIAPNVRGSNVLDLFCGTGALSLEAVSRGAASAVMCDVSKESLALSRKNVEHAGFEGQCELLNTDAVSFLNTTAKKFDIVFLDPPYNSGLAEKSLELIFSKEILNDGGIVVLERDDTDSFQTPYAVLKKEKRYGRTYICIYEKE